MSEIAIDPRFVDRARQPGLDLLRALAIIVVVIYHAALFGFATPGEWDRFGWIGVDLFFVLSGYLIGGQLLVPLGRGHSLKLRRFFARRALRILPAYFVVLAIYFLLPSTREFSDISPLWKFVISVQNIGLRGGTAFSHAWSLAVEDQFYLLLPFTLLLVRQSRRAAFLLPIAIVVGGLALRGFLASNNLIATGTVSFRAFQKLIYYPSWTRLDALAFGVALAAIEKFRPGWWRYLTNHAPWLLLLGIAALSYGLYLGEGDLTITTCVLQFPLVAFGMATLLLSAVSPRLPLHRLKLPGVAFIASIAYSVYLSHKLAIHQVVLFCASHEIATDSRTAHLVVEASIYLLGAVLFFAIERPFLRLRRRLVP